MSITVYFSPTNMTPETYDEALNRLEAAGVGAPREGSTTSVSMSREYSESSMCGVHSRSSRPSARS